MRISALAFFIFVEKNINNVAFLEDSYIRLL